MKPERDSPEVWDEASACAKLAGQLMRKLAQLTDFAPSSRSATALSYVGILMMKDLGVPASVVHDWIDRLYECDAHVIVPASEAEC